jgi:teichuronic acid biosynthesis glycosyltransferase TuaC
MGCSVLTLSHLYPSPAFPGSGIFVRDEVVELSRSNRMAVVAPIPWHVRRSFQPRRRDIAVPYRSSDSGITVVRPRFPGIPVGGRLIEPNLWARRLRPTLNRLYREIDGDLIHAHFALPDGYAAAHHASRHDVPFILTVWGSDVLVLGRQAISRGQLRWTFERARAVVAVSDELAERANALGVRSDLIHVVAGGVPFQGRQSREEARASLGLDLSMVCVVWVGNLLEVKQPMDAIRAFAAVLGDAAGNDVRLIVIGDGPLRSRMARVVDELKLGHVVELLGYLPREAVWRWQCAADVQISSSKSEGTPIAILEALGAGTPVATYPLPGIQAAVRAVDGGTVATNSSPLSLAQAIGLELSKPRDRDQLANRAREHFGISEAARAIESVYATVL